MARTGRRKTTVEMLRRQKELGQTNQEYAASVGMSVETIKRWRALLRVRVSVQNAALAEWKPVAESASVARQFSAQRPSRANSASDRPSRRFGRCGRFAKRKGFKTRTVLVDRFVVGLDWAPAYVYFAVT